MLDVNFEDISYANFFWHGSELSLYEYACISSFVKNGFRVRVFSYENLLLPDGAESADASTILPASYLKKYTQQGQPENLPAFSDAFRYNLISKMGGWWFDSDVFCLVSVEEFYSLLKNKHEKLSLGYESENLINGAVIYLKNLEYIKYLLDELNRIGTHFRWGEIGPNLLTRMVKHFNLDSDVENSDIYYPIGWRDYRNLIDPNYNSWCKHKSKNSLSIHLWNEIRRIHRIPNNVLPPKGSFVHDVFITACPNLSHMPSLPIDAVNKLGKDFSRQG